MAVGRIGPRKCLDISGGVFRISADDAEWPPNAAPARANARDASAAACGESLLLAASSACGANRETSPPRSRSSPQIAQEE
jgi:hypothetical protein